MIAFKTRGGSTYEVDPAAKTFRQTEGRGPERRKQWRRYASIVGPEVGSRCVIVLHEDQSTVYTSEVVAVLS